MSRGRGMGQTLTGSEKHKPTPWKYSHMSRMCVACTTSVIGLSSLELVSLASPIAVSGFSG